MADERWETVTVDFPPDLKEEMEDYVDGANVFDHRSQFIRAAVRTFLDEETDEFGEAR